MSMDVNEFIADVYENAVKHGWHESERPFAEICALIHSELSEALEEYRCKRGAVWYGEHEKPEGYAIELIDAVIRVFDEMGNSLVKSRFNSMNDMVKYGRACEDEELHMQYTFPEFICYLHSLVTNAYESSKKCFGVESLIMPVCKIFEWLDEEGLDYEELLTKKHAYNKTREYRHGNKIC